MPFTIAATGHRPPKLGGYSTPNLALERAALSAIVALQPDRVISGMALGWDQEIALAAMQYEIPVIAAVPFREQPQRWPSSSQVRYYSILRRCEHVEYVSTNAEPLKAMQLRNIWMVDNAQLMAALWNGSAGGTANCIRYAQRQHVPIRNFWEKFEQMRENAEII